ncbi:MAG: hypothetical protein ACODAJ_12460, partial [Planctomycetota bacterium]
MRALGRCVLFLGAATAAAAAGGVAPVQRALPPQAVTEIRGFFGQRYRANIQNRLMPFEVERYIRMVEEPTYRDWFWIGEQHGKWLEAAVDASRQAGHGALREKAEA